MYNWVESLCRGGRKNSSEEVIRQGLLNLKMKYKDEFLEWTFLANSRLIQCTECVWNRIENMRSDWRQVAGTEFLGGNEMKIALLLTNLWIGKAWGGWGPLNIQFGNHLGLRDRREEGILLKLKPGLVLANQIRLRISKTEVVASRQPTDGSRLRVETEKSVQSFRRKTISCWLSRMDVENRKRTSKPLNGTAP